MCLTLFLRLFYKATYKKSNLQQQTKRVTTLESLTRMFWRRSTVYKVWLYNPTGSRTTQNTKSKLIHLKCIHWDQPDTEKQRANCVSICIAVCLWYSNSEKERRVSVRQLCINTQTLWLMGHTLYGISGVANRLVIGVLLWHPCLRCPVFMSWL